MKGKHEVVWVMTSKSDNDVPWDGKDTTKRRLKWEENEPKGTSIDDCPPTMWEYAEFFDINCESTNQIDLCGLHFMFCKEWEKVFGTEMAEKLMKHLASMGGLECMTWENN